MMLRHGYSILLTVFLSLSLAGCFGGGGSSKSDAGTGDRSSETADGQDAELKLTDDFSVEAGTSVILIDGGGEYPLVGRVINPKGVAIAETYWRVFDDGFYRIDSTTSSSSADNTYDLQTERRLDEVVYAYQFVAIDVDGRAAVDTVYVRVGAYPLTVSANLRSESVTEGQSFSLQVVLDNVLSQDLTIEYQLQSGTAVVGEDVPECNPCALVIPAGETVGVISLETTQDEIQEENETFSVSFPVLEASFGITEAVELTILDQEDVRPVLHIVQSQLSVTEKDGYIDVPLRVEFQDEDSYEAGAISTGQAITMADDKGNTFEAILPFDAPLLTVAAGFDGSATDGEDYSGFSNGSIYDLYGSSPFIRIPILDDVESEDIETIIMTLSDSEYFRVGESNVATIQVQSDDVRHMASASKAYCTVQDNVGMRCWGDFANGKTETPALGEVEKLVGAQDYFCAIHIQDGQRQLDCWGATPNNQVVSQEAPDDVFALNNELCVLSDGVITCVGPNGEGGEYTRAGTAMIGGMDAYCELGLPDGVVNCSRGAYENVRPLLNDKAKYVGSNVDDGEVSYSISCALSDGQVACDFMEYPAYSNPQDIELLSVLGTAAVLCAIDEVEGVSQLVCTLGERNLPIAEFFGEAIVEPYNLTGDPTSHICVAHLNGVSCMDSVINRPLSPLLALDAPAITEIAASSLEYLEWSTEFNLCGLIEGDLHCTNPGYWNNQSFTYDSQTLSMDRLDLEGGMPAVVNSEGSIVHFTRGEEFLVPNTLELNSPLSSSDFMVKGDGFACASIGAQVLCHEYATEAAVSSPALDVAPTQFAGGANEVCAIVDGELLCWGSVPQPRRWLSDITSPVVAFDMSGFSGCIVTEADQIHCWGNLSEIIITEDVNVGEVYAVDTSNEQVCVLGAEALQCWGFSNNTRTQMNFTNVTDLAVADGFVCVVEEQKLRCWGKYMEPQVASTSF